MTGWREKWKGWRKGAKLGVYSKILFPSFCSSCGRSNLQCRSIGEAQCVNNVIANEDAEGQISVEGCPMEDLIVQTPLKEVNVSWPEPRFMEANNNGRHPVIARVEQNLKPGQVMKGIRKMFTTTSNRSSLGANTRPFTWHSTIVPCL